MKGIILLLFSVLLLYSSAAAQNKPNARVSDTFEELDSGNLVLRFFDALTGKPIEGGEAIIGELGTFTSDFEGRALFPAPEDAVYKVRFSHPKYITCKFDLEIMAGTIFFNRYSVSPKLPLGSMRIVVDWEKEPYDLDAHFVKQGGYHISFRNMRVSSDGTARLDRDDTDGNGPETITANRIDNSALYSYFIHDFSNRLKKENSGLSKSKATVKVFSGAELLGIYQVPQNFTGNYWEVFRINNGNIEGVNQLASTEP